MTVTIRPADPECDYERVAEMMRTFERKPVTADTIKEWDAHKMSGTVLRRCVAVDQVGHIVGYSGVIHDAWMTEGWFVVWIITDPAIRQQGIGTLLYDDALPFAREHGATLLHTDVLDNDPNSLHFAEKRGFNKWRHQFESVLDFRLKPFDESPFVGVIESVEASGIRLFSLADEGNTPEALYKLWQVNYETALEDPAASGTFPNFEEFQRITSTGKWFQPDGQLLAADGDKYVGLAAIGYYADTNIAYHMMTGVLSSYRGRKIALALKLKTIRVAQQWGADYIGTDNDSTNAPMLKINRKLGYVQQPGLFRMTKPLSGDNQRD